MFRIELFCEDRDLPGILHDLAGRKVEYTVTPVMGTNPALQQQTKAGLPRQRQTQLKRADIVAIGGAGAMLAKLMREQKLVEANATQVRDLCKKMGLSPASYSHVLNDAVKGGFIKKGGRNPDGMGFMWKLVGDK